MDSPSQDSVPGYETMPTEGGGGLLPPPTLSDQQPQPETQPSCPNWDVPGYEKMITEGGGGFLPPPTLSDQQPQPETQPSCPNWDVPGYEKMLIEGGGGFLPPPMLFDQQPQPVPQPSFQKWDFPSLSKDDAQQAFIQYASNKRCYSTKPAEQGVITNMESFDTYRYRLVTFTETRTTERSERPHYGEKIDNSGLTPPGPWEIPVNVPPFFQDDSHIVEIPHTASVTRCFHCSARGYTTCGSCGGLGRRICSGCGGLGTVYYGQNRQFCIVCGGSGRTICYLCGGTGETTCDVCSGQKMVIAALNLVVNWHNDVEEHTVEQSSGLKMSKLDNVPGRELFTDSNYMVYPVTNFPDPTVVQVSERLLREHQDKYLKNSRILQQRQTIELLPITKVTYQWKGESYVFFVYGRDFKVSAVDYPAACCGCCCPIM
ncbi:protein SSUH2 homolog isoform X1 [Micropterus dolomieu]|uniref:protein SSUH2 homolog isoform X1 n=1 Tax=Micropterus dolomieu TaxID=147949 RepID=UPI001E8EA94D|nr:protein SSUH2 homolog isoform X1 [Micropterus dolomieu]